jgi:CRISPR-associated protein Csb2
VRVTRCHLGRATNAAERIDLRVRRLLRALVATWHTRWPDLPVAMLEGLLDELGDPSAYRTPQGRSGHTRHYLPDLYHRKGETGATDLTLDSFLLVRPDDDLLVRWDAELSGGHRQTFAKLAELLPYLGRSESVCEARLLDADPLPDDTWWRAGAVGASSRVRLLTPTRPVTRAALEATTTDVRKRRRTIPAGTRWVTFGCGASPQAEDVSGGELAVGTAKPVTAVRFAVTGSVPMRETHGVLLADEVHNQVGRALERAGIPDGERSRILGSNGASTDHDHAHWIPLTGVGEKPQAVLSMVVWMPGGLRPEDVAAVISLPKISGRRGSGYEIRGFPEVRLLFQAAGPVEQVAPELCGVSRRWRSRTPYLPVRYRKKRESLEDFLTADVYTELRYRGLPPASVRSVNQEPRMPDRWAREFRRYRMTEDMSKSRPGLGLRLEFAEPVSGPLLLGQLSHFGYGIFEPEPS